MLSVVLLWLLILTNATDEMIAMMMTETTLPTNKATWIFRPDGGACPPRLAAATELLIEFFSEPGPGLVALGAKR